MYQVNDLSGKRTYKQVKIVWYDSHIYNGWWNEGEVFEDSDYKLPEIISVGFLLDEQADFVTIATSVGDYNGEYRFHNIMKIPQKCIQKIEKSG